MAKPEASFRTGRPRVRPDQLMERLGYRFRDTGLLMRALTPPSAGLPEHNQRLEFLGDALLQATMGLLLFREKPDWDEGRLSKLRSTLVSHVALRTWAEDLGVVLVDGPRSPRKPTAQGVGKPISDAMEALLAAVFLDAQAVGEDGHATLGRLVSDRFLEEVRAAHPGVWEIRDSKTTLQERAAALQLSAPIYETLAQVGPEHAPRFRVRVRLGSWEAVGEGGTVKGAQMEAAKGMLTLIPVTGA